ncbi:hypothetical protein GCM10009773_00830 [Williamsia serinedens]
MTTQHGDGEDEHPDRGHPGEDSQGDGESGDREARLRMSGAHKGKRSRRDARPGTRHLDDRTRRRTGGPLSTAATD